VFTGIITEVGKVVSLLPESLTVRASQVLEGLALGDSIAVNGTCLTATAFDTTSFTVGLSAETLKRTNLGELRVGDPVNLEPAMRLGGKLGGHLVQGHIDGTGRIVSLTPASGSTVFRFAAPEEIMRYVVEKGFIAVDGISFTISARGADYFEVSVIDYTRAHTTFNVRRAGDKVNLEIDIMAKYAEQFSQARRSNLTLEYLKDSGF
jgi:riboflavin synthase